MAYLAMRGSGAAGPVRQLMTRASGPTYRAQTPAGRPLTDYVARLIAQFPNVAVRLEAAQMLWQR
jgi:hypothetical protein